MKQSPTPVPQINVPPAILEILRCPRCGEPLGGPVDGEIACAHGHKMSIQKGYLDALDRPTLDDDTVRTLSSFGYEWTTFSKIRTEDEFFWEKYFEDVPLEQLTNKVGLDAGCGKGRYTRFTAQYLKALIALDGSDAVTSAVENLSDLGNVTVIKADLRSALFMPESLGFVSSLGVLHHLANPKAGFDTLWQWLAPDGLFLLYLYSQPTGRGVRSFALNAAAAMRRITPRLPHRGLRAACVPLSALLYLSVVVPGALAQRMRLGIETSLPLATYRRRPWRSLWLDTFDRLSAPLEKRFTWEELATWFSDNDKTVVAKRDEAGWFVLLRKTQNL